MKKSMLVTLGLFLLGISVAAASGASQVVLGFGTMVGVSGPFIGSENAIRGVNGAGAPWVVLGQTVGQLTQDGQLNVQVRGLVLASTQMNPSPNFRGLVSCLSVCDDGQVITVNVSTDNFPADTNGNSDIAATVELPATCFAPIIFVTAPAGAWFATTGF